MTEVTEPHYRPFFGDVGTDVSVKVSGPLLGPLARRAVRKGAQSGLARRAYLAWLNHAQGKVPMNMVATKPCATSARTSRSGRCGGCHEPWVPLLACATIVARGVPRAKCRARLSRPPRRCAGLPQATIMRLERRVPEPPAPVALP